MEQMRPRNHLDHFGPSDERLRRIIGAAAMVLTILILAAVAIYAGAFLMLAPMMQ
jgi:hypothetical protein